MLLAETWQVPVRLRQTRQWLSQIQREAGSPIAGLKARGFDLAQVQGRFCRASGLVGSVFLAGDRRDVSGIAATGNEDGHGDLIAGSSIAIRAQVVHAIRSAGI